MTYAPYNSPCETEVHHVVVEERYGIEVFKPGNTLRAAPKAVFV
jgi:hypothetical protein